ncbi:MAG: hypothetical protein JWN44_1141 [Myxococcales bacterium]|nr:hypothetical protein [Myxococcales bacterium]
MFTYASLSVPWWVRALVATYEAGVLLVPVAAALFMAASLSPMRARSI